MAPKRTAARYRILSLDGGGIRGVVSLILLKRLEAQVPGWLDQVDLLAGTSTGGLIAMGLANGLTVDALLQTYATQGGGIFDDSWMDNALDLGSLIGSQYDNTNLKAALDHMFGETRLCDLHKRVLVPAFDLDNENPDPLKRRWAPKFFHNFPGPDSDGERLCRDVALYTGSAPTYFPVADGYIDGGVVAGHPGMAALAQTQDRRSNPEPPALKDIRLISFGTGESLVRIEGQDLDWGRAQWAKPIIDIMMDGTLGVPDYQCRQILGSNYCRLAPMLPPGQVVPMDAVNRVPDLVALAQSFDLSVAIDWLQRSWS